MNPDPVLTGSGSGSGLFSEVGSGPNRSGSATLVVRQSADVIHGKLPDYLTKSHTLFPFLVKNPEYSIIRKHCLVLTVPCSINIYPESIVEQSRK